MSGERKMRTMLLVVVFCVVSAPLAVAEPPTQSQLKLQRLVPPGPFGDLNIARLPSGLPDPGKCADISKKKYLREHRFCVTVRWRLLVLPARLPPTRTVISFDSVAGEHVAVEWDPLVETRLPRTVVLAKGDWQVSIWTQPDRPDNPGKPGLSFAWDPRTLRLHLKEMADNNGYITVAAGGVPRSKKKSGTDKDGEEEKVRIYLQRLPFLTAEQTAESLAKTAFGSVGGRSLSAGRSLGGIPEPVSELLQTITEVVVERAKSKASRLVTEKLAKLICDDLAVSADVLAKALGSNTGVISGRKLLPNTCSVIESFRIDDLAREGKRLVDAILRDTIRLGSGLAVHLAAKNLPEPLRPLVRDIVTRVADYALASASPLAKTNPQHPGDLAVSLMNAVVAWGKTLQTGGVWGDVATLATFVFGVAADCHGSGGCDAHALASRIGRAGDYFNLEERMPALIRRRQPELTRLARQVLAVVAPDPGTSDRARLTAAVQLGFGVMALIGGELRNSTRIAVDHASELAGLVAECRKNMNPSDALQCLASHVAAIHGLVKSNPDPTKYSALFKFVDCPSIGNITKNLECMQGRWDDAQAIQRRTTDLVDLAKHVVTDQASKLCASSPGSPRSPEKLRVCSGISQALEILKLGGDILAAAVNSDSHGVMSGVVNLLDWWSDMPDGGSASIRKLAKILVENGVQRR